MSLMTPRALRLLGIALLALALAGCASDESRFADLRQFMDGVYAKPPRKVNPLPESPPYQSFSYSATTMRPPFTPPEPPPPPLPPGTPEIEPDPNRVKEYLEGFDIAALAMVGSLSRDAEMYALIQDAEGGVHRVTSGDYMGQNHGKIVGISESEILLEEIVSNGAGGWIIRNRTVMLAGNE